MNPSRIVFELAVGKASQAAEGCARQGGAGESAGWVAQHGEIVIVPDLRRTHGLRQSDEKTKMETRSIGGGAGEFRDTCLGVIELIIASARKVLTPATLKLLEALSGLRGDCAGKCAAREADFMS